MAETLKTHRHGAVGHILLSRPERMNAFNLTMCRELIAAFHDLDADPEVRGIVVSGEGRAFCAGADIEGGFGGGMNTSEPPPTENGIVRDSGGWLNLEIWELDTPVIAAVHGAAVGVGFTMLLPMDIIIAATGTKMAVPFTRRGIVFDGAASYFLPRVVGMAVAKDWSITGRTLLAEEAHTAGMIAEMADDGEAALARALEIATDIAERCSPESVALNKQLLRASVENEAGDYPTARKSLHMQESEMLNARFVSPDCAEGVKSFFEKRKPEFAAYKKA